MPDHAPDRSQQPASADLFPRISNHLLHVVADYKPGDLAMAEVLDRLVEHLPDSCRIHCTSVHNFNTVETGFVVAQLVLKPHVEGWQGSRIIFANCAPRGDRRGARVDNEGEPLVYGELANGAKLLAVNSEYSLSVVRDYLTNLWVVNVDRGGSQFRSRDNFPPIVGMVAQGKNIEDFLGKRLDPGKAIPQMPSNIVGYVDNFYNIKTTFRADSPEVLGLVPGEEVEVRIGHTSYENVKVATGSFNVKEGELAFAPGSSGYDNRFWEIFQRRGEAAKLFGDPSAGTPIVLRRKAA